MNSLVLQFITEVRDYIDEAVRGFLSLEQTNHDQAIINGIFRNFHTIKGTSGIFPEFAPITSLTHAAEDLMDQVRNAQRSIDTELIDLFLNVLDLLSNWLEQLEQSGSLPDAAQTASDVLRNRILGLLNLSDLSPDSLEITLASNEDEQSIARRQTICKWASRLEEPERDRLASLAGSPLVICYIPAPDCFFFGEDPVNLFRQISTVQMLSAFLPEACLPINEVDPFSCHLSFLAVVNESSDQLDALFGYVLELVTIVPLAEALALPKLLAETEKEEVAEGAKSVLTEAASPDTIQHDVVKNIRKGGSSSIRVDQSLINHLMDLVGEIIIAKNSLPYLCRRASDEFKVPVLAEGIDQSYSDINHVVEGLQLIAMDIRMLPVANAFERFPRLVRDISHKLGKIISLELQGEDTRADKDVIEALTEPLVHMVRNCLDHGIEMPDVRVAAGKSAEGHIVLRAKQESSSLVIEISDDGKGINPVVIRKKAAEKGICGAEALAAMTDDEVIQLVMAPNFSTSETVSDLSGRGVGMDAVQTMVTGLHGSLYLASSLGKGTTVRLTLPLSRAITKVLTIRQNGCAFGIPVDNVIESFIDIPHSMIKNVWNEPGLNVRDDIYPLYSLSRYLQMEPTDVPFPEKFSAVVVRVSGEIIALAVEELSDIIDVIVKPLQGILAANPFYTGNTILGDGSILFLLNMQEFTRHGR